MLGCSRNAVVQWENGLRPISAIVSALLRIYEAWFRREKRTPEHIVGYDPDGGARYVVRLHAPSFVLQEGGDVTWLDPEPSGDEKGALVLHARAILRRF